MALKDDEMRANETQSKNAAYVSLEKRIGKSESAGIFARWEFGKQLLSERVGKQLPKGRLDEVAKAVGSTRQEVSFRMTFATRYPTRTKVSTAVETFGSWTAIRDSFGEKTAAQRIVASDENEWYTPKMYLDVARKVLGRIDLDPASSESANKTVKATTFYAEQDDGLKQPWHGRLWLNPPYGRLAGDFIRRLVLEWHAGEVEAAIALVNAHCTDTEWFQGMWDGVLCFTNHRIDFNSNGREKTTTSTHGSVFGYFGPDPAVFQEQFKQFGAIVKRV